MCYCASDSTKSKLENGVQTDSNACMRHFYNLFPYPNRPLLFFPNARMATTAHLGFQRALAQKKFAVAEAFWRKSKTGTRVSDKEWDLLRSRISNNDRILLAGCGTDEPLLFRTLHPKQEIVAIDLSERSIEKAGKRIRIFEFLKRNTMAKKLGVPKTRLLAADFMNCSTADLGGNFSFVQCFGVLHHQNNPWPFLDKLIAATASSGFLRIMIYSANGRRLERRVQRSHAELWKKSSKTYPILFQHFLLWLWQLANKFGLWGTAAKDRFNYLGLSAATVADALLHPSDPGLDPDDLMKYFKNTGMKFLYCEAKIYKKGWKVGIEQPEEAWEEIIAAEKKCNLISNITVTFMKP